MNTRHHELKPPQELVDAIQASGDMTAPPDATAASDLAGSNVPRTIKNKLAHEDYQPMTEKQEQILDERAAGADHSTFLADPQERRDHLAEVQKEQEVAMRFDRNHPGAGRAGQGDADTTQGMQAIRSNARQTGKGPHYKDYTSGARHFPSTGKNLS